MRRPRGLTTSDDPIPLVLESNLIDVPELLSRPTALPQVLVMSETSFIESFRGAIDTERCLSPGSSCVAASRWSVFAPAFGLGCSCVSGNRLRAFSRADRDKREGDARSEVAPGSELTAGSRVAPGSDVPAKSEVAPGSGLSVVITPNAVVASILSAGRSSATAAPEFNRWPHSGQMPVAAIPSAIVVLQEGQINIRAYLNRLSNR